MGYLELKDHVLEFGMFIRFSKKKVADPNDPAYIERFIMKCNYGVQVYLWNFILGFVPMLYFSKDIAICFILPAAISNSILNILPLIILRYNVPILNRLLLCLRKRLIAAARSKSLLPSPHLLNKGTLFFKHIN